MRAGIDDVGSLLFKPVYKRIDTMKCSVHSVIVNRLVTVVLFVALLACVTSCSKSTYAPPPPLPEDTRHIPEPKESGYNNIEYLFDRQFTEQLDQTFDLSRLCRKLVGSPKQAYNIDAFDEVPNSSWFTNRNATQRMSVDEIARGPDTGSGPDTSGVWLITRAKAEGVTPGFTIKDESGESYVIKFDPVGFSGLATGAEVISTKFFHAAGYYVPENYIVYFHPRILELGEKVKFTDEKGKKRYATQEDLDKLLDRIEKQPDGRIRVLASRYIKGKYVGHFSYKGTRRDDPNDIVPHEHRRELRGLRVISAWLNHYDTKAGNSFDAYVTEDGRSYIKHYLIDFGSTLGSMAQGPMQPNIGYENQFDPYAISMNLVNLGISVRPYEKFEGVRYPCVGLYESRDFSPGDYKFIVPNPAFELCTIRDGFWGAKIVMSFTDEQIDAVVEQAQYPDPEAEAYIARVIKERRDMTGRYWFDLVNPLDKFEVVEGNGDQQRLCFTDLAVEGGLEDWETTRYRYDLRVGGTRVIKSSENVSGTCITLPDRLEQNKLSNGRMEKSSDDLHWEVKFKTYRESEEAWSRWVKVHLVADKTTGRFTIVGVTRQE